MKKKDRDNRPNTIENTSGGSLVRRRDVLIAVIAIFIFAILMGGALYYMDDDDDTNTAYRKRYSDYNDGWSVIIDGNREMLDLPTKVRSGNDGEIIIKKSLPDPIPKYSAIATRNYHQRMEVSVNGELIYSYPGEDWNGITGIISDEWHVINLKSDTSRGTLEIKFIDTSIDNFSGYISDVYFGDDNSIIQHIRDTGFWPFVSGIIMLVLGLVLICVSWIYRKPTNQSPNAAMGLAFFCFGLWNLNRSKMPFFSTNNNALFLFSLIALMFVAPFVFLYCHYRNKEYKNLSLRAFQGCIVLNIFVIASSFFIDYNVQTIAMVSYFLVLLAFILNGWLLFRASFGKNAELRNRIELLLDRTEFFANLLLPVASIVEMVISKRQLWTEVSGFFRGVLLIYAIVYMVFVLWRTYLVVQDRVNIAERLQESQLELMMGQIQPHFIFNTLSSIRTLVKVDPDVAYKMLYDFSNYLRANVDNVTNLDGIKFSAEVSHIKSYVNIEKVRFGDRLNVEYDIGEEDFVVPPLSIQPLVENAIKHGVVRKIEGGTVELKSYKEGNNYVVEIIDDGVGFDAESAAHVFCIYEEDDEKVGVESNAAALEALRDVISNLDLKDSHGNAIELNGPVKRTDLSGNGSEEHKSTGMKNIILRLREMSNAKIYISSQEGKGTRIRVLFPGTTENS